MYENSTPPAKVNTTQRMKSALRLAFPAAKFSIQYNGKRVSWSDDGPTIEQVQDALLKAGCATEQERSSWNGHRVLLTTGDDEHWISFNRYNVAELEAAKIESERRQQEWRDQQEKKEQAVRDASRALYERAGKVTD
jgi:hypothetical protein